MTNAQIIFNEAMELMNKGIIGTTGRKITLINEDGTKEQVNEPEEIHTYKEWQNLGMQVQKGQKAIAKFTIWMFTNKPSKAAKVAAEAEGKEAEADPHYYMKEAAFFSASQVAPAAPAKKEEPKKEENKHELETVYSFMIDADYIDNLVNA